MDEAKLETLGATIVEALPGAALSHRVAFGDLDVTVDLAKIVDVVRVLRDDARFRFVNIVDITAVDYPGRDARFDVVYHFLSPTLNARVRLRGAAGE
ncbi:UNVERIFIED_CONTAM: NADH-quinone oxidoreductase subunit C, partial [Bacteroidetes bacterium 56_B9]